MLERMRLAIALVVGLMSALNAGATPQLILSDGTQETFIGSFVPDQVMFKSKLKHNNDNLILGPVLFGFLINDRIFPAFFGKTSAVLTLKKVSPDGSKIYADYRVQSPRLARPEELKGLEPLLSSGRDYFNVLLELEVQDCNGKPASRLSFKGDALEEVIADFYQLEESEFEFCRFKVVSAVMADAPKAKYVHEVVSLNTVLTVLGTGDIVLESGLSGANHRILLSRQVAEERNDNAAAQTWSEAQKFIQLLRNYGEILILNKDKSKAERENISNTYLQKNKNDIVQTLKAVNAGYSTLSYQMKIKLAQMISGNYRNIHFLEGKITHQFSLDEIVTREMKAVDLRSGF